MRFIVEPKKKPDPADESGKKKIEYLQATIWPGPWSLEHTAEEKQMIQEFSGDQAGLDAAIAWLKETYAADQPHWDVKPSLLDSVPDR